MDHKTFINTEELLIRIEKNDYILLLSQVKNCLKNRRLPLQTVEFQICPPDYEDTDGQLKNIYELSNTK